MRPYYFERALFVVGESNAGKSVQLRSMFRDIRFGTNGKVPTARNLTELYKLSNERSLYLRLTSPHEKHETIGRKHADVAEADFLRKTDKKMAGNTPSYGRRWNFAGALQPYESNYMPDVERTCRAFVAYFRPERTRVVFLSPDQYGNVLQKDHVSLVDRLRAIPSVELVWIDARERTMNGLLLADFFDFA